MTTRSEFCSKFPDAFFLDAEKAEDLEAFLLEANVLQQGDSLAAVEKAGEGNMNCSLRARSHAGQSFIVKQARPWVEKYPQFSAPRDRALSEIEFYRLASRDSSLKAALPEVLFTDEVSRLFVLQDLGDAGDCSDIYSGSEMSEVEVIALAKFLSLLHRQFQGDPVVAKLENREMRALNHAHIFDIPFVEGNGLDLDEILAGLAEVGASVRRDALLVKEIRDLGESVYLAGATDTACLLHGDFFPGSFLRTEDGLRIIDPEFSFGGRPEFDSGVFVAHLVLGQQAPELVARFLETYEPPDGHCERTQLQIAGAEIIRRILGYAQLPLISSLEQRELMLQKARLLVLEPEREIVLA